MVYNDCVDAESIGCGFNAFKESDEIAALIGKLKNPDTEPREVEKNLERYSFILSQYQDQPHLLDPHLELILGDLIAIVKDENADDTVKNNTFKYLFILMSVKRYKNIATHLPHEVIDLVPVLRMLEKQDPTDVTTWETRYVLLIWLSIISKIPFPLSRLEISDHVEPSQTIIFRISEISKLYCMSKDACSVAAVFLIANFLTRSDVKNLYLEEMIMWCLKCLEKDSTSHGPLAVLASILKHCARDDLKQYGQLIFDKVNKSNLRESPAVLVRKFQIKVVQRIGFILLRLKLATWRYQKSSRQITLLSTLPVTTLNKNELDNEETTANDNEELDVPPITEEIIEQLIQGLRDKAITIRWSAAKGIGRITCRLPVELADEVVGFVLNLFSGRESDSAWHGGCLALAELGRRGLILPHRLGDVIPLVLRALVFDEPRAYGSVGSIIRDAACYVCWSFARAFEPKVFEPYVKEVAACLLIVTCFDREINCRRAASAAFQENVGRQGNFPHGIDILTVADYFEVGVRSNAYLKISVHIAQYEEYTIPMIDHLVARKVTHWDTAIRELASKALNNLTAKNPRYMVEIVLPNLLDFVSSIDLNVRHGAVLAIAEILEALHIEYNDKIENVIGNPAVSDIKSIIMNLKTRGQFKGLGGELMKQACALLIEKCARVRFPIHGTSIVEDWLHLLEECLSHEVAVVKLRSAEAHTAFLNEYYVDSTVSKEQRYTLVDRYLDRLKSHNQNVRIGFAQAIGHFPKLMLRERVNDFIESLITCSHMKDDTVLWAESRKEALNSLTMTYQTLGVDDAESWKPYVDRLYECYLLALKEYTTDSRGDIGAWVREAAMSGLHTLTMLVSQTYLESFPSESLMAKVIGGIAQQAVERIDRTRVQAGTVFSALIHSDPALPNIPYHAELKGIFPYEECVKQIDWKTESVTFPRFIRMLTYPPYTTALLRGIIFSVGGLSESLVKYSSVSLFSYLKEIDEASLEKLVDKVLDIFEESYNDERMITSSLTFLDRLMSSGCVQSIIDNSETQIPNRMLLLLKREIKAHGTTKLIMSTIKVFCQLLQVRGPVSKKAFSQLSILLCNKYTCLRKATAVRTYEALTLYGEDMDLPENDLAKILIELNATDWEQPVPVLRPIRNHLCELMGVSVPVLQKQVPS